uniref:Uncharacterized protein n=1 Tax=Arundo donax TaxID=35708 RepID=A0A0A8XVF4_ARUDO
MLSPARALPPPPPRVFPRPILAVG